MADELRALVFFALALAAIVWAWLRPDAADALVRYFSDDDGPGQT